MIRDWTSTCLMLAVCAEVEIYGVKISHEKMKPTYTHIHTHRIK